MAGQPLRTCKAWVQDAPGDPSRGQVLKIVDRKLPTTLQPGQVMVKVASAALNPIDHKILEGKMPMGSFPMHPGFDFAGEVIEAAADSGFTVGQEVFGDSVNLKAASPKGGSLSEVIVVDKSQVALKPAGITFVEASSLPLVGQTVLDCMAVAKPPPGARVLILGASGGVGTVAVQICKARGLYVVGVCSGKNRDLVMSLGADEVIDYKEKDWSAYLEDKKVEVVFQFGHSSAANGESWDQATRVMNRGGRFVDISGPHPEGAVNACVMVQVGCQTLARNTCSGFKYHFVLKMGEAKKLQELAKLVDEKKLIPVVAKVYGFDQLSEAYGHVMSGRATGKICVTVPI